MANTANKVDDLPVQIGGGIGVAEYEISIDTVNSDLTVRTAPNSTDRIWITGILFSENASGKLVIKSKNGATVNKSKTIELGANQGAWEGVKNSFLFATKAGDDLVVQSSMLLTSLTLFTTDGYRFNCR